MITSARWFRAVVTTALLVVALAIACRILGLSPEGCPLMGALAA
jgi:hypothetical protein